MKRQLRIWIVFAWRVNWKITVVYYYYTMQFIMEIMILYYVMSIKN